MIDDAYAPLVRTELLKPARQKAGALGHPQLDLDHILWSDAEAENGVVRRLLGPERISKFLDDLNHFCLTKAHDSDGGGPDSLAVRLIHESLLSAIGPPDTCLQRMAAVRRGHLEAPITWEEFLSCVFSYRPHRVVPLLRDYGLSGTVVQRPPAEKLRGTSGDREPREVPPELAAFTTDLTSRAELGLIGKVIGRDKVIDDVTAILACKEANNPILLGDAGVGKTKIVEGIAQRFLSGMPGRNKLRNVRLLSLDLGLLVAGAQYLGQFEDRLRSVLRSLQEGSGRYILFIDEIHLLLGLGKTTGAMDAANLMKPALARGELWCIGATTYSEFKLIEGDPALRRRFQSVDVPEQSVKEVEQILRAVAPLYETYHGVCYEEGTIPTVARLARRYLGDTRSPSREIALLDELGARAALGTEHVTGTPSKAVRVSDVKSAVARRTGIPVDRIGRAAAEAVRDIDVRLAERVTGQDPILRAVVRSIRRASAGLNRPGRPRAVFLFSGPSGVGKTELAKALAEQLYDTPDSVIRLDMSEFNSETARTRLIGSDPGYVGYEEGGRLTEAVRRRPYSLILLDEFEKAHPTVWRLFLQVFDDGRLTDARGRTVSFADTIIVLTTNVGAQLVSKARELHAAVTKVCTHATEPGNARDSAMQLYEQAVRGLSGQVSTYEDVLASETERALNGDLAEPDDCAITRLALLAVPSFPPELFGRIGMPLVFRPLGPESLRRVLEKCLRDLCIRIAGNRYPDLPVERSLQSAWIKEMPVADGSLQITCGPPKKKHLVGITLARQWCEHLIEHGQDPVFGARALESLFASEVEDAMADAILKGSPRDPSLYNLELPNNHGGAN